MPKEKNYHMRSFSPARRILADYNNVAASLNRVYGLIEIDITKSLEKITKIAEQQNYKVSMTAWVAKCVSKAVMENKHLNSYRKGRRKIVIFDTIDISIIVEVTNKEGKKVPFNYVIRNVEKKSVKMITEEIRKAQKKKINELEQLTRDTSTFHSLYLLVPRFLRRFVIKRMITNPFRLKKLIGTVGITSLGMFIPGQGGWAIPYPDKTLNIAIGGIKENAIIRNGEIEQRKLLCTTFSFDHDLVDGAPAARFVSRLSELMGKTTYLDDLEKV